MTQADDNNMVVLQSGDAAPALREVRHEHTHSLPALLNRLGVTLLVTTYQAGKLAASTGAVLARAVQNW